MPKIKKQVIFPYILKCSSNHFNLIDDDDDNNKMLKLKGHMRHTHNNKADNNDSNDHIITINARLLP